MYILPVPIFITLYSFGIPPKKKTRMEMSEISQFEKQKKTTKKMYQKKTTVCDAA